MPKAEVTIHLIPGDPVFGVWCHWCLLPSAVRLTITRLDSRGVTPAGTVTYCPECDEYDRG